MAEHDGEVSDEILNTRQRELERWLASKPSDPLSALAAWLEQSPLGARAPGQEYPGARIADYVLMRLLGRGGLGATWLAQDDHNALVALKILHRPISQELRRFEDEAVALSRLAHPHIVRYLAHGIDREGERGWIAMEWVPGASLEAVLARLELEPTADEPPFIARMRGDPCEPDPARRWLKTLHALASALAASHALGIVHRDLKPGNVIVREDGTPILIDFGISRDLLRPLTHSSSLTLIGTPGYMAPEQLRKDTSGIGPWTDVYAFGALLHRIFLGRERHDQSDPWNLDFTRQALLLPPEDAERLPPGLLGLLYACLELDPKRRPKDAGMVAEELRRLLLGADPTLLPPGRVKRFLRDRRSVLRAGVMAGVAGLAASAFGISRLLANRHQLSIYAFNSGDVVYANDRVVGNPPLTNIDFPPGDYEFAYGPRRFSMVALKQRKTLGPERRYESVIFRTISTSHTSSLTITLSLYDGDDYCLFHIAAPEAASLWIDGELLPRQADGTQQRWIRCKPGRYTVKAELPSESISETQVIDLVPRETQEVWLLRGPNTNPEWVFFSFHPQDTIRTIGSVIMPLPEDVEFWWDDGLVPYLAGSSDAGNRAAGYFAVNSSLAAMVVDQPVSCVVRASFPEPMRDIRFQVRFDNTVSPGAWTKIDFRVNEDAWNPLEATDPCHMSLRIPQDKPAALRLEVRVTLFAKQVPSNFAMTSAFLGRIDPVRDACPAFLVAAHP